MFDLSFATIGLLSAWILLLLVVLRLNTAIAEGLRPRMITLLGAVLLASGFFFQPWIEFDFLSYINPTPEFIRQLIPVELLPLLVERYGVEWLSRSLRILTILTQLNGWQIELIPTLSLWTRFWSLLPLFSLALAIASTIFGSTFRGGWFPRAMGTVMVLLGVVNSGFLLLDLAAIDNLGIYGDFRWKLLAAILGARLGNGPWFCILGLLSTAVGGLVEIVDRSPSRVNLESEGEHDF
jgi:hypothetical protein